MERTTLKQSRSAKKPKCKKLGDFIGALGPVKPLKLLKVLQEQYGFSARQGKGDHVVLSDQKGHFTVIQVGQKELRQQIMNRILRQTGLKLEDIEKFL